MDAGFGHNKAGVLRDMIVRTLYIFKMLYQCYMTELPLSGTHFKMLLHLMCNIMALPSPHQTSVSVVSLTSLIKSIVFKETHYSFINLLVVSHYVPCTPFPCSYNVTKSTHKGSI